jgi:putative nucleotidyltransferase with HDIG domain
LNAAHIKQLHDEKAALEFKNRQYQKSLESMVEQRTVSLQKAMQSIFTLLETVVEVRDPYTAGHQRRVGNLSAAIAKKLGHNGDSVELFRIIGYIHDIGKIVVPGEILSKPGHLTRLEFEMIQNHCEMGFEMLSKVNLPDFIAESIYQHHERCDGSGYPRGLKGDQMLLEAKILAVADVVEAMMSHRPYRPALGLSAALNEIQCKSDCGFDKEVVDACVALFESDCYVIDDQEYIVRFPLDIKPHS